MSTVITNGKLSKSKKSPKRSSASYPHEKLIRVKSEDIKAYKPPKGEIERLQRMKDSEIDFSDIPQLTPEQLAKMVSFREFRKRIPVSVRVDPRVIATL